MKSRFFLMLVFLSLGACAAPSKTKNAQAPTYDSRPEVAAFIEEMVEAHGFSQEALTAQFAQIRPNAHVLRLITPAVVPELQRNWANYRARFVLPTTVRWAVEFAKANDAALTKAEATYGVPKEIILSIIGVETGYGRNTGSFGVLEALSSLAFDYAPRAPYFRGELVQFLLYARENGFDPLSFKGSYAGAMGIPQFMPTSLRKWAVDFDGDHKIDLKNSPADAIGSVAHYFVAHGWKTGEPVAFVASLKEGADIPALLAQKEATLLELNEAGVLVVKVEPDQKAFLFDLPTPNLPTDYWVGLHNFSVITRYNRSNFYAMAVFELSEMIKAALPPSLP